MLKDNYFFLQGVDTMTHSSFWKIFLVTSSLASAFFAYHYLPQALSILDVTITMNREEAIQKSKDIIIAKNLLANGYEHATYFTRDSMLQYYIELAAGGKKTFKELLKNHDIEPYQWYVRWYKEGMTQEARVTFTPEGIPYSFFKKMAETDVAQNVSEHEARLLAEKEAAMYWNIDFSIYKPFEYSKEEQPCGRIDHIFTYQKENVSLGEEGKYRVKIIVSGDTVTGVNPFVFIPESFLRRYDQMRSENNTLATIAQSLYRLLYIFGGVLLGAWLIYRRRLYFKYAIMVGLTTAILTLGSLLSEWPFLFINYNTALSKKSVLLMYALNCARSIGIGTLMIILCAAISTSLDKLVFPQHESLWSFFKLRIAGRRRIVWYVLGAYLGVLIKLAVVTNNYLFLTGPYVEWWSPASMLVDPNILACYIPWLTPLLQSFEAGFSEELIFRVIPLAGAALLGRFFNREKIFLVVGIVIQALIFAAVHANYMTYPSYFRLVELFLPATIYGLLYIRWGLIPVIILHWIYDLVLMGLPIFISTASGMWFNKILLSILGLMPLLYVIYAYYRTSDLLEEERNKEEQEVETAKSRTKMDNTQLLTVDYMPQSMTTDTFWNRSKRLVCMMVGFVALFFIYNFYNGVVCNYMKIPTVTSEYVRNDSYKRLQEMNPEFAQYATQLYSLESHINSFRPRSSFAWRTETPETYFSLTDKYVYPITWIVSYKRFNGTQVERAQEYIFTYTKDGNLIDTEHLISDQIAANSFSKEEVRIKSLKAIEEKYKLEPAQLKEIKCELIQKPARTDWCLIFEDISRSLKVGNTYIRVDWRGQELSFMRGFLFIPESWNRSLDQEKLYSNVMSYIFQVLFYMIVMLGIFYIRSSFAYILDLYTAGKIILILAIATIVSKFVFFSTVTYHFNASMDWTNQLISHLMPWAVRSIVMSACIALGYLCYNYSWRISIKKHTPDIISSLSINFILICMNGIIAHSIPSYIPWLGNPTLLNSKYPLIGLLTFYCESILPSLILFYFAFVGLNRFTHFGTRYRICIPILMMIIITKILGIGILSIYALVPLLGALALVGLVGTYLYYVFIRYNLFAFLHGYGLFFIISEISDNYYYMPLSALLIISLLYFFLYRDYIMTLRIHKSL